MSPQWLKVHFVHSLHKKDNLTKMFASYVLFISFFKIFLMESKEMH